MMQNHVQETIVAGKVLVLIDDSEPPFWVVDKHVWTDIACPKRWLKVLKVNDFSESDALKRTVDCVSQANLTGDYELLVVTDSRFHQNPHGGADLLEQLREASSSRIAWKRGVIYSQEPERGQLGLPSGELRLVRRRDEPRLEGDYIATFLETGKYPDLAAIRRLRQALTPLLYCCDSLLVSDAPPTLRPMKEYGVPRTGSEKTAHPFDPVLITSTNRPELFSPSTAEDFMDPIKATFVNYLTLGGKDANSGKRGELTPHDPDGDWGIVLRNLHPWESLEPGSAPGETPAVRLLWEIIRTGGDPLLLSGHPATRAEGLTARERAWVREQMGTTVAVGFTATHATGLQELVKRVVREVQSLDQVLRLVADGECLASGAES